MHSSFLYGLAMALLFAGFTACDQSYSKELDADVTAEITKQKDTPKGRNLSQNFKDYWYAGTAEITSYRLVQERYGELREGTSVNIFVTEDFLPKEQVKANRSSAANIPVLKLNNTKKFNTGIYPYSIMNSTFSPVGYTGHALKVAHSMQEWCGQVYMQLNNRSNFEIQIHSYFEGEADQELSLPKTWLESELWNLLRINPAELPTGDLSIIPSFEYMRMRHKEPAAQMAYAILKQGDSMSSYEIEYPSMQRQLTIYFNSSFPFEIEKWEETNAARNNNGPQLKTTATKMKRMRSAYWKQNSNKYVVLRDSLGLR